MSSSGAYMAVYLYICLYLYHSVWLCVSLFGNHKTVARNCTQRMRPQATGSAV